MSGNFEGRPTTSQFQEAFRDLGEMLRTYLTELRHTYGDQPIPFSTFRSHAYLYKLLYEAWQQHERQGEFAASFEAWQQHERKGE
mgnify:CR=1 FL=1